MDHLGKCVVEITASETQRHGGQAGPGREQQGDQVGVAECLSESLALDDQSQQSLADQDCDQQRRKRAVPPRNHTRRPLRKEPLERERKQDARRPQALDDGPGSSHPRKPTAMTTFVIGSESMTANAWGPTPTDVNLV